MSNSSSLHHILRIFIPENAMERRTAEVIDYCRRTGCREVLWFTGDYMPSFVPIDEIRDTVRKFAPYAERIREAGITFSVNVLQTVGHVSFPLSLQNEFPFQRRVYTDGRVSTEGACPLCPNLQDWVVEAYGIYATLMPRVIFVDDDFRAAMQGLSCLCDRHLARIGQLAGRAVTREEVAHGIHDPSETPALLRRHYHEATTQGFVELAARIHAAVKSVSPQTRIGGMTAYFPSAVAGMDWARIFPALCGSDRPLLRPQMPMYEEGFPRDLPGALTNMDRFRAVLPANVEYWPEIENFRYSLYAKSAQCTFVQMAAAVLQGFDHLALNIFDPFDAPLFAEGEPLVAHLASCRAFLDGLHALIPEGHRPLGARIFVHRDQWLVKRNPAKAHSHFLGCLFNLGLPMTHSGPSPWNLLVGDDVLALSDAELDATLRGGALLNTVAAEALAMRGLEERIGVRVGEPFALDELYCEEWLPSGRRLHAALGVEAGDWRRLTDLSGRGRCTSRILNYRKDVMGPALLLTENEKGERFGVFACRGGGDRHFFENPFRAVQIREALAWIARRPLPVAVSTDAPYLWPILNRTADGRHVLGLINLSTDTYQFLPLLMETAPDTISLLGGDGKLRPVDFRVEPHASGLQQVSIQHTAGPLALTVLVYQYAGKEKT